MYFGLLEGMATAKEFGCCCMYTLALPAFVYVLYIFISIFISMLLCIYLNCTYTFFLPFLPDLSMMTSIISITSSHFPHITDVILHV